MLATGQNIVGKSFFDLLRYMRVVLLQNAVALFDLQDSHPVFDHLLFGSASFFTSRAELVLKLDSTAHPEHVLLLQAMLVLSEDIQEIRTENA